MIRLFVALELPEELRARIALLQTGLPGARWVPPENLHLSLRFLGQIPEPTAEEVAAALARVRAAPFDLVVSGAGHFETGRRVRAVWLGVEKSPALSDLQERVEAAATRAGLPPEGRKFIPHITLARLENGRPNAVHRWLSGTTLFKAYPFRIEEFVLFSSHLGRGGSVYRAEVVYPLDRAAVASAH